MHIKPLPSARAAEEWSRTPRGAGLGGLWGLSPCIIPHSAHLFTQQGEFAQKIMGPPLRVVKSCSGSPGRAAGGSVCAVTPGAWLGRVAGRSTAVVWGCCRCWGTAVDPRQQGWAVPGKGTGARSTGDVNCCSLPEVNTAMLIYTQESVAKYARSGGTTWHPLTP